MDKHSDARRAPKGVAGAAAALVALAVSLAGCDSIRLNPLSPNDRLFKTVEEDDPRLPPPTAMRFNLETLAEASSLLATRINPDDGLYERRRNWTTAEAAGVRASMILRQRLNGREIPVPDDIRRAAALWPDLETKALDFEALYATRNALGPVRWRRFVAGGQACVLFQQGLGENPGEPTRLLAGHYCAAAGDGLTPGQAETVVRSVQLIDKDG